MFSKRITLSLSFILLPVLMMAQVNESMLDEKELEVHILEQDSLLFHLFFEKMDSAGVEPLIHEDFEFYHDLSGFMDSKEQFLNTVSAFQQMEQKISREIIPSATECFYLYDSDLLYAVLQRGEHVFYEQYPNQEKRETSRAKFSHLWVLSEGQWCLKRVFSFEHILPASPQ